MRRLGLMRMSILNMDMHHLPSYPHGLTKSSPHLGLSCHPKPNTIIKSLNETIYLFYLGENQESCMMRQLHKLHLVLSNYHALLEQMLKLTIQFILPSE